MDTAATKPTLVALIFLSSSFVYACSPAPTPPPEAATSPPSVPSPTVEVSQPAEPTEGDETSQGELGGFDVDAGRFRGDLSGQPDSDGTTAVSGRLSPEVIRRIVRQHSAQFRRCYESGLLREINLALRVVVRFTISRSGSVANVSSGASGVQPTSAGNVADAVANCVAGAFGRMSFPTPEGEIVTVSYPIHFSPSP